MNPEVQRAVNRWQPFPVVERAVDWLRNAGIHGINVDLIYGLPRQTAARVLHSVEAALTGRHRVVAIFVMVAIAGVPILIVAAVVHVGAAQGLVRRGVVWGQAHGPLQEADCRGVVQVQLRQAGDRAAVNLTALAMSSARAI